MRPVTPGPDRRARLRRWLRASPAALLAADGLLVLAHALWSRRCDLLDVHADVSLPGWFVGAQLLMMAVLAWWFALDARGPRRRERATLWLASALGFAGLSLEKTLQLHQRASRAVLQTDLGAVIRQGALGGDAMKDAYGWVIVLLPLMLAMLYFLIVFCRDEFRHERATRWWWFAGLALAVCHPLLETDIYWLPPMHEWTPHVLRLYAALSLVRRAAEMAAVSCLLIALLRHLRCSLESPR